MKIFTEKIAVLGLIAVCGAALFASCAKEATTPLNESNKLYFDAWMSINHPNVPATGYGVYIIDETPGTGAPLGEDGTYIFVDYTVRGLDGTITNTTSEKIAQQVGTFSNSTYYGSVVQVLDNNYAPEGILQGISGMKVGGTRTIVVPGWLNVVDPQNSAEDYLKNCSGSNAIYTIKIDGVTDDIDKWQIDTLEKFAAAKMNGVDSTKYGYYCQQLVAPKDTTTLSRDTTFYINYTGRLLNGKVFDTTIKDTAKVYGIYSASKTYEPQKVTLSETYTDITMGSSSETGSTVVEGFAYCLSNMKLYEKCRCAFYATYGYGYSGSGKSIPSYSPISFEIEMVDAPE